MAPFGGMFTAPTWQRVLVLLIGAVPSPGRRTVAAALRVTGLGQDPHFTNYHHVLNRSRWSSRRVARRLFCLLASAFVPNGPVSIGLDDCRIASSGMLPGVDPLPHLKCSRPGFGGDGHEARAVQR